ncbi:MAG: FecR family protein [Nitrospirota bacterium]|nr:FecR family protein [Nitrospirota bacterium]MDH5585086.1 FecR family protein [Nitrospirota bacterium]MDH5774647.1 FecR family protein [Nitrospirota bacterium]
MRVLSYLKRALFGLGVLTLFLTSGGFATSALAEQESVGTAKKGIGGFVIVRMDGIEERLEGNGNLQLYEGDVLKTEAASQALIEFSNGIQVALNENTEFTILSRWEKASGFTRILRLKQGEVWVDTQGGPKPLEIETPVATAAVKGTEFDLLVSPDGQSTLTVIKGVVEFGTAFGTCPIKTSTISYGNRGKKCTKPAPLNVGPTVAWTNGIRQ